MTTVVAVQREVELLKQTIGHKNEKDIWVVWVSPCPDPDVEAEAWRVTTHAFPKPAGVHCKNKDVEKAIALCRADRKQTQNRSAKFGFSI